MHTCYLCGQRLGKVKAVNRLLGVLLAKKLSTSYYKYCVVHLNSGVVLRPPQNVIDSPEYQKRWRVYFYHFTGQAVRVPSAPQEQVTA